MKVIVNADDLGMDEATNAEIFRLMSLHKVTSSTIMANAPYVEEAVRETKHFPHCSFGIHLNLTEFYPLSDSARLMPLLDAEGCFRPENEDMTVSACTMKPVVTELSEQIRKLRSLGVTISHIDSHQHIHTIPGLFPAVKYLQYKFNIRKIRLSREYPDTGVYSFKMRIKKRLFNFGLRHVISSSTTEGFSSLQGFMANSKQILENCRSFEIMVHPGKYSSEDAIIQSEWQASLPHKINLLSYNQL